MAEVARLKSDLEANEARLDTLLKENEVRNEVCSLNKKRI